MTGLPVLEWHPYGWPDDGTLHDYRVTDWSDIDVASIDVTGAGYWVRLGTGGDDGPALVIRQAGHDRLERAWCSMGDALAYVAEISRHHVDRRDELIATLLTMFDTLSVLRFAATLG